MTRLLRGAFAAACALAVAGCGGSNPGSGSRTLHAQAVAQSDGSNDATYFVLQLREGHRDGPLVTDAQVRVRGDQTGEFILPWEELDFGGFSLGSYRRVGVMWDTGWWLEVERGADRLDAYLEAPGLTSITEPVESTTYRAAIEGPLEVRWKDGHGRRAQTVEISLDESNFAWSLRDDPLEYFVEPRRLVPTESERVEVIRRNELELEGGTPGSTFSATTRHRVWFSVQ